MLLVIRGQLLRPWPLCATLSESNNMLCTKHLVMFLQTESNWIRINATLSAHQRKCVGCNAHGRYDLKLRAHSGHIWSTAKHHHCIKTCLHTNTHVQGWVTQTLRSAWTIDLISADLLAHKYNREIVLVWMLLCHHVNSYPPYMSTQKYTRAGLDNTNSALSMDYRINFSRCPNKEVQQRDSIGTLVRMLLCNHVVVIWRPLRRPWRLCANQTTCCAPIT